MNDKHCCIYFPALLVLAVLVCFRPCSSLALTIDGDQQFQFAEELFSSRQYRRAAEEYQRFAFFFPLDSRQRPARFKAGQAFLLAKDPNTALNSFRELISDNEWDTISVDAYFMIAECYLQMKMTTQAVVELNNLITLSDDSMVRDRAHYRLGWIFINQTDWPSAGHEFEKVTAAGRKKYRIDELERALGQADRLPDRNPTLAGALSIIPGAGQLYCNRYEDALIAFAVNVGLFWAAHDAFDQDQYALGGLLTFVGLGFYTGNIYSAVSDAHKFNLRQKQQFGESLKRYVILGISPHTPRSTNGVLLSLHVPF